VAFEGLTDRLQEVFRKLRGHGKIREADVKEAMREVRRALLEADVHYKVAKDFVAAVGDRALGQEVLTSITPGQQIIKIVHDELSRLMGGEESRLAVSSRPPSVYMMVGLQGAGKTTMAAKLALFLKRAQGKNPLLAACDVYRPAAVRQLQLLGEQIGVQVFAAEADPAAIAIGALERARAERFDPLIIDTAGRLHIDEPLMQELAALKERCEPHEILLVVDAMTGQDAVNVAERFHAALTLSGVALTKLDGDSRGGAALSVKAVTGCPIKFAGLGEKLDHLEVFHPDRMASRILGMGDMLTLIEKAERSLDSEKARELEGRLRSNRFTLTDFYDQLVQLRGMGSLSDIVGMMPGLDKRALAGAKFDERTLSRTEAIILSMTAQERENPAILNSSRKRRVASGSGTRVEEVNKLLKQFETMRQMSRRVMGVGGKPPRGGKKNRNLPFGF
jgi:signal recognition particle subunit SRP54